MNMAEEVVFRLCLEDKVQDFRGTEVLVQNAQRRIMCDKDVKVGGNFLVGNAGISGRRKQQDRALMDIIINRQCSNKYTNSCHQLSYDKYQRHRQSVYHSLKH